MSEVNAQDATLAPESNWLATFAGGLLSKAGETGLDIIKAKNTNQPGTVYPTGQTNPAQIQAQAVADPGMSTKTILLIVGGGVAALLVVGLLLRSNK